MKIKSSSTTLLLASSTPSIHADGSQVFIPSEFLFQETPHSPNSSIVTHPRCSGATGCKEQLWSVLKKRTAKELNETA